MSVDTTKLKSYEDYKAKIQENLDALYNLTVGKPIYMQHENVKDKKLLEQIQQLENDNTFLIARVLTDKLRNNYIKLDEPKEGNKENLFPIGEPERIIAFPMFFAKYDDTPPSIEFSTMFFGASYKLEQDDDKSEEYEMMDSRIVNNEYHETFLMHYVDAANYMYIHSIDEFFKKFEETIITKREFIDKFTSYATDSLRNLETNLH